MPALTLSTTFSHSAAVDSASPAGPAGKLPKTEARATAKEAAKAKTVAQASGPLRHAGASASQAPAQLRLTRRGRLVFIGLPLMLTAAAALTVLGFFTAPAMASNGAPEVTETLQVSVTAGDSLWGLAEEFAPGRDPRDVVADIMELNNLSGDSVSAGVQLYIPVQP